MSIYYKALIIDKFKKNFYYHHMRKPVFPRILVLFFIYCIFFTLIISVQFPGLQRVSGMTRNDIIRELDPGRFILPLAESNEVFLGEISAWRENAFSEWSSIIQRAGDEDIVIAYLSESILRGNYRPALASISQDFLRSSSRTYESSVFLGGMVNAGLSYASADLGKLSRISQSIENSSLDFLLEKNVLDFLAVRAQFDQIIVAAELIRSARTDAIVLELIPGIFEGYMDWHFIHPGIVNPFERLVDDARFYLLPLLHLDEENELLFIWEEMDDSGNFLVNTFFNLRLGKALFNYGEFINDNEYEGIGRSLILSALSLETSSLAKAMFYREVFLSPFLPRSVALRLESGNISALTAAENISISQRSNGYDISVSFPLGEAHYMIIRGVEPFSRIQLNNVDYRTAPDFEIYNSSGYVYNAQDRTLLLKIMHREDIEYIRIFY